MGGPAARTGYKLYSTETCFFTPIRDTFCALYEGCMCQLQMSQP